jgi:protein-disulfide isomerase
MNLEGNYVKLLKLVFASVLLFNALSLNAADGQFSPTQKKQIESIVRDYLVSNPEVLVEVSQALQKKQQTNMMQQAQSAINDNASAVFSAKSPEVGNPKGNVTLVEFFDYQCIHCKKMAPVIEKLVKKDKNLRVIYKEFPIFGKGSNVASQAALAAAMQGKYKAFHNALLGLNQKLNEALVMKTAKSVGLDMAQLKKDMNSAKVKQALAENMKLAEALRLMGTPAFIIGSTPNGQFKAGSETFFVPGAATEQTLQNYINKASNAS